MSKREVLYFLKRDINSIMVTRHESIVTLWCPLKTKQSQADLDNPHLPMLEYAKLCLCTLLFVPEPLQMLVIGLGGGTIPTALAAATAGASIDVVEIDPEIASIAEEHFHFRTSERLRLIIGDGAYFVRESQTPYDIIIVDAYTGASPSASVYSESFYADVSRSLKEGGIAAVNIITGNKTLFKDNLRLIHRAFGSVTTLDCRGSNNTVIFAGKQKIRKSILLQNAELVEHKLPTGFRPSSMIDHFKGIPILDRARWQIL